MSDQRFERPEDIPELIPEGLLIPEDRPNLRVPQRTAHSSDTTTPREVSYCFMNYAGGFIVEKQGLVDLWIMKHETDPDTVRREIIDYLSSSGRHLARATLRASLDPDRFAPINMLEVYENERAGYPNPGEELFFAHFIEYHGVLTNRGR